VKAYWQNLNDRERWMLGLGVTFCIFYLFYLVVYAPLTTAIDDKSKQLREKQETLAWMQQIRHQPKTTHAPQSLTNTQLLTLIANQLRNTSFKQFPYQLQQTGVGEIQLSFDQVPFNPFMVWLWSLNQKYVVSIKQFSADHTDVAGVVKLMVVIAAKEP